MILFYYLALSNIISKVYFMDWPSPQDMLLYGCLDKQNALKLLHYMNMCHKFLTKPNTSMIQV